MSKLLERLMRERLEKEARKLERERKKKEREKEKKKEERKKERLRAKKERKREQHVKKLRHKQNQRYYKKKRDAFLKEKKRIGDVKGIFTVYIMKDMKKYKKLGRVTWKTEAYEIFNKAIEQNRKEVLYPQKTYDRPLKKQKNVDYDIIIVQKISDADDTVTHFRDEDGKFIEHEIIDKSGYKIIDRKEWYIEETFSVYGYHPNKDRKTFKFIRDEIVFKDVTPETSRRVFVYRNHVFVQYNSTFDFISCRTKKEAERLYDALYKIGEKNKYVIFTGRSPRGVSAWLRNEIEKMTGWKC